MRIIFPAIVLLAAGLSACVTAPPKSDEGPSLTRAAEQPIRDLNLIRDEPAAVLLRVRRDPYSIEDGDSCAPLAAEIVELDAALGPDLSKQTKTESGISPTSLAAGLVSGAIGLPYSGAVRVVSGAEEREHEVRAAVLAGMVRRAFLKGRARQLGCVAGEKAN